VISFAISPIAAAVVLHWDALLLASPSVYLFPDEGAHASVAPPNFAEQSARVINAFIVAAKSRQSSSPSTWHRLSSPSELSQTSLPN
jgi:hypothetical protein